MYEPTGNPLGQPKKYKTAKLMSDKIDEYFVMCDAKPRPYTVISMCLYLDLTRETLLQYQKLEGYSDAILRAKTMIEGYAEDCLYVAKNPTGIIFNLKNNWKWHDKTEVITTNTETKLTEAQIDAKLKELES